MQQPHQKRALGAISRVRGDRFALERELTAGEHDPAHGFGIPPGTT
jgi:hypothetical protein